MRLIHLRGSNAEKFIFSEATTRKTVPLPATIFFEETAQPEKKRFHDITQ